MDTPDLIVCKVFDTDVPPYGNKKPQGISAPAARFQKWELITQPTRGEARIDFLFQSSR